MDYLKQKISPVDKAGEFLDKERDFNKGLQQLKSAPVDMVPDFQNAVTKDLPVQKINTIGEVLPVKSGAEFAADQAARQARKAAVESVGDTLNYGDLRRQFAQKAQSAARSGAGRKLLGALPLVGGIANALMSGDASAAVPGLDAAEATGPQPGTFDDRVANGQLTDEDKQKLMMEQSRIKALQNVGR